MATITKDKKENTERLALSNPYNEEMVTIKLFKDNDKYKDDVFVSRNGMNYQIQRGVVIDVPKGIAEILENQERMDQKVTDTIAEAVAKSEKF